MPIELVGKQCLLTWLGNLVDITGNLTREDTMLSGINTTALSQMYNSQAQDYGNLSLQIASGKKINKPSDDCDCYTRNQNIGQEIKSY